jgi:hypothetical protein
MAITKRPPVQRKEVLESTQKAQEAFIGAAPDGLEVTLKKRVIRGRRVQISHTLPSALLASVDERAERKGLTRAGLINLAISEFLETH